MAADNQPYVSAAQDADDVARTQAEWEHVQERVKRNPSDDRIHRQAVRFVLVHAFGTEREYLFDPEFHARVGLAEQMLWALSELQIDGSGCAP